MKLATPAPVIVPAGVQVVAVCVKVEPAGYLSLLATLYVPGCPGWPVLASFTASTTGLVLVPEQVLPVQFGSPPPVTLAVFTVGFAAFAATATGTVMMMLPVAAPAAIVQPVSVLAPLPGHPESVPPVAVIAPLVVTPAGSASLTLIAAVLGPLATLIVIV